VLVQLKQVTNVREAFTKGRLFAVVADTILGNGSNEWPGYQGGQPVNVRAMER